MNEEEPFNKYYAQYEEWFERNRSVYLSEIKALEHFIPKKGRGLEVGIGSGRFAQPLGIEEGVDPSEEMRKIAQRRGLKVYDGVAEDLPFPKKSFDYCLMVTTICFVEDVNKTLKEIYRVLKNKGNLITGLVDKDSLLGKEYQKHKNENVFYKHAKFYATEDVKQLLKENNFVNLKIIQTVFGELGKINTIQDFKEGYGEGGFVVIKAEKTAIISR